MLSEKLKLKLYLVESEDFDAEGIVPVFHRWIREGALGDELLIDVTSYTHVPDGPGVLLVGHGSDYAFDFDEGRAGLTYFRKREAPAESERLRDALSRALRAAEILEGEAALGGKKFRTDEIRISIPDRLSSPNTDETFDRERAELATFFRGLLAGDVTLERDGSAREPFSVRIRAARSISVGALREKLG